MAQETRPKQKQGTRKLLRLCLRGLLFGIILLCVALAWVANRANSQRKAVAAIRKAGGWVYYDTNYSDGIPSRGSTNDFLPEGNSLLPVWLASGVNKGKSLARRP